MIWAVYKFLDTDGCCVYVGCTKDLTQRLASHRNTKDWWHEVDRVKVARRFDTRQAALKFERTLIYRHRPRYNKNDNPDWERPRYYARHAATLGEQAFRAIYGSPPGTEGLFVTPPSQ